MTESENLIIRAHHLPTFAAALRMGPHRMAIEQFHSAFESISDNPNYYFDVIGFGDTDGPSYQDKLQAAFEILEHAPSEQTITIRPDARDGLCKACAVGDHCKVTDWVVEREQLQRFGDACLQRHIKIQDDQDSITINAGLLRQVLTEAY